MLNAIPSHISIGTDAIFVHFERRDQKPAGFVMFRLSEDTTELEGVELQFSTTLSERQKVTYIDDAATFVNDEFEKRGIECRIEPVVS